MSTHPEVLWAQRSSASAVEKNLIYLTVNLPDIVADTLEYELTSTTISFKARTSGPPTEYAFKLDLYAEVDAEKSTKRLTSRSLFVVLRKKELQLEYWPRLTKDKRKSPFLKTDFSRWVDEDEQDGVPAVDEDELGGMPGLGSDFDFSKLGGLGAGAGNAEPGDDPADTDDDDSGPPPLEDVEPAK